MALSAYVAEAVQMQSIDTNRGLWGRPSPSRHRVGLAVQPNTGATVYAASQGSNVSVIDVPGFHSTDYRRYPAESVGVALSPNADNAYVTIA